MIVVVLAVTFFYPFVWFADATRGTVVDSRTGKPVANAVVSMTWVLESLERYPVDYLHSFETTTDARGHFEVPGFWPRVNVGLGSVNRTQPNIRILASGYMPFRQQNSSNGSAAWIYAGASFDGNSFGLQPLGSAADSKRALGFFEVDFWFLNAAAHSGPRRFPRTLQLLVPLRTAADAGDQPRPRD